MLPEQPEDFEPSPDDLRKAEELFGQIGDENVLSDAENLEIQHELDNPSEEELIRRRGELREHFHKAGDYLKLLPENFRERQALRHILGAVISLLTPSSIHGDARMARHHLENALAAIKPFIKPLAPEDEE
jgi:uncharacterized membrane-anchored protein YhcB (DUF1043 family)